MEDIALVKAAACIGVSIAMGLGIFGPALGQGLVGMKACENMGKYPESADKIRTAMMLAMALIETCAIYVLLIAGAVVMLTLYR